MNKGAKLISGDILGLNFKNIEVHGRFYTITPPTIEKIAGAAYYLSDFGFVESKEDLIAQMKMAGSAAAALSWFVRGDDSLTKEFSKGTVEEVCNGLEAALSLIDVENFMRLSVLAGNVARLTARPRS